MEYKTLFIVCIFILAIFTLGAVSASEEVSSDSLAVNEIWEVQGQTVSSLDENYDLTYFDDEITGNWSDVNDDPVDDEITGNWSVPVDDEITGNWSDVNDDPVDDGDDENDDEDGIHASIWNDEDERGPIYTDSEGSIIDVDVPGGFEGSIIVMINGEEKGNWEIEHEDDDWAYHGWGLEDLDMAEAGFYHILVLCQNEDNPDGEIIANETVTVKEFAYDELRALILYAAESIKLFVPDGAQGTVTIITDIEVEDGEPEQINEISYEITSQDYGNWIDWSLEDLGFEADNRFRIFTLTVTNNDEEIYRYRISHVDGEVDDDEGLENMEFYMAGPDEEEKIFDRESDVVVAKLYIPQRGQYEGLDPTITASKNGVVIKSKKSSELNRYYSGRGIKYEFTLDLTQFADKDILEFSVDAMDDLECAGVVEVRNNQVVIHDDYDSERFEFDVFYGNTTTGDVNDFELMGPHFNGRLFIIVISDSLGINDGTFTIKDGDSTVFSKKLSECDAKYDYASLGYEYSLNLADVLSIIPDERDLLMSFSYANNTMNEYRIKFDDYIYKGNLAEDIFDQYDIEVSDDKVLNENDTVISIISDTNRQSIYIECGGGYFTVYVDGKKVEHLGEISYNNWLTISDWREDDGDFIDVYHGDEESFIHDVKEYWGDELELFRLTSWHQSSPYVYLTLADLGITESGTYNIRITHYPSVAGGLDDHTNMWEDRNYAAEYFIPTETELINTEITVNLLDLDGNVTKDNFFMYFDENGVLTSNLTEIKFTGDFTGLEIDTITLNRANIIVQDAAFTDISFSITSGDVTISNTTLNYTSPKDSDAYAILANQVSGFIMLNSEIIFTGQTEGTYVNNAVRINGGSNIKIKDNYFMITIPSAAIPWHEEPVGSANWVSAPVSEGIVIADCDDVEFDSNVVNVRYNNVIGEYDTIYSIDIKNSSNVAITNSQISSQGNTYIYGLTVSGENFEISNNLIDVASDYYASAIEIGSSSRGIVNNNIINANAKSSAYPIYSSAIYGPISVDYTDNNISADAYFAAGIYADSELIKGNIISLSGNYTVGIVVPSEATVDENIIILDASNTGNESIWESIPVETAGIVVKNNADISNNAVDSNVKSISVIGGSSTFSNNELKGYVYINSDGNKVSNNLIITENDYAIVINASNNVIGPNDMQAKDVNGTDAIDDQGENNTIIGGDRISSVIISNDVEFDYNASGSANITLVGASDIIAYVINHEEATVTFDNGIITVSDLDAGEYTLNITTVPDNGYAAVSKLVDVTVNKINVNLTVDVNDVSIGDETSIVIRVTGIGNVAVKVDGNTYVVAIADGVGYLNIVLDAAGNYEANVRFDGDNNINPAEVNASFKVIKLTPEIVIVTGEAIEGSDLVVDVEIDNATGAVNVNDEIVSLVDGKATATIKNLTAGDLDVVVRYDGDDKYSNATKVINVTVMPKQSPDLEVSVENINFGQTANVDIAINAEITGKVTVDGKEVVIENGKAKYNISDLNAGNYSVTVAFEGDKYFNSDEKTVTFNVNKIDSTITVSDVVMNYGDSVNVTVVAEGAVGITSMIGVNEVTPVGFEIPVSGLDAGSYTLTVTTVPDDNHNAVTGTVAVVVNKVDSTLILSESVVSIDYGAVGAVGVNFTGASGVVVDLDGASVDGGVITVSGLDVGNYTLTVTTVPDDNHNAVSGTVAVVVNAIDSAVNVSDIIFDYGSIGSGEVSFTNAAGVVAGIDGFADAVVVEGAVIKVFGLDAGSYVLTVTTVPEANYNPVTVNATVTVKKIASSVVVSDVVFDYGSFGTTNISFTGASGVTASVINNTDAVIDIKDNVITISGLDAGQYLLKVTTIPEANYNAASKVVNLTVNKLSTAVISAKVSVTYGSSKNLIVTLKDSNGNVLANKTVTVKLNNVLYTKTTNSKGQISVALPKTLAVKTYTVSITFAGDSNYAKATGSQKVTVSKATPKIAASAKSFKVKTKTKKYTITLKTNLNKVMKSTKVTLKVKGKTYAAKTNSKGKATFKITKLTKKGKYAAVVTYKGSSKYKAVSKKVKIIVK